VVVTAGSTCSRPCIAQRTNALSVPALAEYVLIVSAMSPAPCVRAAPQKGWSAAQHPDLFDGSIRSEPHA
jgi:hypothetical protein